VNLNYAKNKSIVCDMTTIVLATKPTEIEIIATLAHTIWHEHYTSIIGAAQVTYMVDKFQSQNSINQQIKEGYLYYIINYKNKAVGYLCIKKDKDDLFLSKIYIDKKYRGKKIGRTAMTFIESCAKDMGCTTITLTVNKNNTNSIQAYQNMGFKSKGPIVIDIGNGFIMDDFKMVKPL